MLYYTYFEGEKQASGRQFKVLEAMFDVDVRDEESKKVSFYFVLIFRSRTVNVLGV